LEEFNGIEEQQLADTFTGLSVSPVNFVNKF